jgi:pSer/pThr/pTyr-binding forkhead associated (FHA) protein
MVYEVLKVYGNTTLGRNPAQVSLAFYADEESSVSRLHAAIDPDPSGDFNLTDRNSSAGTRLNGRQIQAGVPVHWRRGRDRAGRPGPPGRSCASTWPPARTSGRTPHADDRTHRWAIAGCPTGRPPLD